MTARGIHSCCPEAPSTINVTRNVIELDGETTVFRDEWFTGAQVSGGNITLSATPYTASTVQLALNALTQRLNVDYIVVGDRVALNFTPAPADVLHFRYLVVGEGTSTVVGSGLAVGTLVGYGSIGVAPDGWLLMNGTQQVTVAAYPDLHAFLALNLHLTVEGTSQGSGPYTLKSVLSSYYNGTTLVSGTTIIKT